MSLYVGEGLISGGGAYCRYAIYIFCKLQIQGGMFPGGRLRRIVLLKVAYYATSSARNFAKLCQNYARIPKLCS